MAEEVQRRGYTFPYLIDETQEVAKAYQAACTPDFYVFDKDRRLVYRGQMDSSRPGNDIPVTGEDLRKALDAVLVRQPGLEAAAGQPGLQHQVEAGQRAGLIHLASWRRPGGLIEVNWDGQGACRSRKPMPASRWAGAREPLRRLASAVGGDGQFTPTITLECRKYAKNLERPAQTLAILVTVAKLGFMRAVAGGCFTIRPSGPRQKEAAFGSPSRVARGSSREPFSVWVFHWE